MHIISSSMTYPCFELALTLVEEEEFETALDKTETEAESRDMEYGIWNMERGTWNMEQAGPTST